MRENAPDLLAENVNHWFDNEPEDRMVRTLDGNIRAFLSDRFRPLDNFDLAEAVLPTLVETSAEIASCEVTERKMYLKAIIPGTIEEIGPPEGFEWGVGNKQVHKVQPGLVVSNSEVGSGALSVSPAVHTIHCTNLAVWHESSLKKFHLGGKLASDNGEIEKYMSDETKRITDAGVWFQVRDLVQAALTGVVFHDIVEELRQARNSKIEGDPIAVVNTVSKIHNFSKEERTGVLSHLIEGGELSQYGLHAAVTRAATDLDSYDRATDLEGVGAQIVHLPKNDWTEIARQT